MHPKTKILIFDDSADLLDVLSIFLTSHAYDVCTVTDEELFIEQLETFKPDLIMLDVYIHYVAKGRKICKKIKSNITTAHIPIILMSANNNDLKNFEECAAENILEKPFNLSDLLQKIKSLTVNNSEKAGTEKKERIM